MIEDKFSKCSIFLHLKIAFFCKYFACYYHLAVNCHKIPKQFSQLRLSKKCVILGKHTFRHEKASLYFFRSFFI